jgi:hypothetical protein
MLLKSMLKSMLRQNLYMKVKRRRAVLRALASELGWAQTAPERRDVVRTVLVFQSTDRTVRIQLINSMQFIGRLGLLFSGLEYILAIDLVQCEVNAVQGTCGDAG